MCSSEFEFQGRTLFASRPPKTTLVSSVPALEPTMLPLKTLDLYAGAFLVFAFLSFLGAAYFGAIRDQPLAFFGFLGTAFTVVGIAFSLRGIQRRVAPQNER